MKYSIQDLPPQLLALDLSQQEKRSSPTPLSTQSDLSKSRQEPNSFSPPFFDAVSLDEAVMLYSAVRHLSPAHSLEVGFCCGGSGLAILKAHSDNQAGGLHHVCDPFQFTYAKGAGLANVASAGLSEVLQFREQFPEEFIPTLPAIQFAFVDASHLFDLSLLEFTLADKKLDVGGVIAFHDMWMPSLQKLVRYILSNHHYKIYTFPDENWRLPVKVSLLRRTVAHALRMLPRADRMFSQEVLNPWGSFGIGNLVFLEKQRRDDRDWRHFVRF